jgi:hypothetical protein
VIGPIVERIRDMEHSPVERDFDPVWANDLKQRIVRGEAITFFWAVAEVARDTSFVSLRVNGQHSSFALGELLQEDALPDDVAIHLDTYAASNGDGAVMLFRQFDARKSARSKEDISGAYQCLHEALAKCNRNILKAAADGVTWYRRVVEEAAIRSGDDVYTIFNETRLHPFFLLADRVLGDGKSNELKPMPVLATMYGTWLMDAKVAEEFWPLVAMGQNRNAADAAADLDAELIRIRDEQEKVSARDRYAKCVKAWHAFNDDIRVSNFKVNTKKKGLPRLGELAD